MSKVQYTSKKNRKYNQIDDIGDENGDWLENVEDYWE